jgi:hypothetical protein
MRMWTPAIDTASSVTCILVILLSLFLVNANAQQSLPESTKSRNVKTRTKDPSESGWPRVFTNGNDTFARKQFRLTDLRRRWNRIPKWSRVSV